MIRTTYRMLAAALLLYCLGLPFGLCCIEAHAGDTGPAGKSIGVGNAPTGEARKESQTPLILDVHPYRTPSELYARFTPLASYLSRRLGRPVMVEVSSSYQSHIERVGMGSADIAFMGPASYVLLTDRYGRLPIVGGVEVNHKRTFVGVIAVQEHGPIRQLSDLYGKRFAFGDPNSTMSHIVPRAMMMDSGVPVEVLASYKFLKSHDDVALGVLYGDFDAGAVKEDVFNDYQRRGLRELVRTEPIAEHVFVASKHVPASIVKALREAMTEADMDDDGKAALFAIDHEITALVPAKDAEYDNLRRMVRMLVTTGAIRE